MKMKLLAITTFSVVATLTSQAAVVAYWDFEEGAGNTTTTERVSSTESDVFSDSWSTSTAAPNSTNAYSFAGTRFGTNRDSAAVGINGSGPKTIMAWINTSSHTASSGTFFGYSPSLGGGAGQDIRLLVKNGGLRMEVSFGGFEMGSGLSDGNWHMVAFVMNAGDGINDVDVYIDGTYTTRSDGGALINTATGEEIGFGSDQNGSRGYTGLLDEVVIFDSALTESELDDIMANGVVWSPRAPSTPVWLEDPIAGDDGYVGVDYAGTLAGKAEDPNSDPITYSRDASGPAWLIVATNGVLSGIPTSAGTNTFTVIADDSVSGSSNATLNIFVSELSDLMIVNIDLTDNPADGPTDAKVAGVVGVAAPIWNPVTSTDPYPDLMDQLGDATTVGFEVTSPIPALGGFGSPNNNDDFFTSYLYLGNQVEETQSSFTISGLSGSATYDLYFYATWPHIDAGTKFSVDGGATWQFSEGVPSESNADFIEGSSYVKFSGVSPDVSGNIDGLWKTAIEGASIAHRGMFNALQIVKTGSADPVTDLVISGPVAGGSGMVLEWTGESGKLYGVETNSNLIISDDWTLWITGQMGDGGTITVTNPIGPNQTFYRIISE